MRVLIACEFSGIVREAFRAKGHDAWSCDLLPTEIKGNHIQGNVLEILNDGWGMMIFFAPCTYLANSGVRWLYNKDESRNEDRWEKMRNAARFFNDLLYSNIPLIAGENPIQHKYARQLIRKYDQIIHPWQFGHGEQKQTCIWLSGLPKLQPTKIVEGRTQRIWKESPSPTRWMDRSRIFSGIAQAMAEQWG